MLVEIAQHLRQARLGHVLLEALPGAALRIGRAEGPSVTVARFGDERSDVLPCQHRAALARSLASGLQRTYAHALGLGYGGALLVELLPPAGADLGSGVFALDEAPNRRLITTTTLCPGHAAQAVHAAQTVPAPAHDLLCREPDLADLHLDVGHDQVLGVTVLSWLHRPHPAVIGPMDDIARAAAAACMVEELLHEI
jgi:hypothetical protein